MRIWTMVVVSLVGFLRWRARSRCPPLPRTANHQPACADVGVRDGRPVRRPPWEDVLRGIVGDPADVRPIGIHHADVFEIVGGGSLERDPFTVLGPRGHLDGDAGPEHLHPRAVDADRGDLHSREPRAGDEDDCASIGREVQRPRVLRIPSIPATGTPSSPTTATSCTSSSSVAGALIRRWLRYRRRPSSRSAPKAPRK